MSQIVDRGDIDLLINMLQTDNKNRNTKEGSSSDLAQIVADRSAFLQRDDELDASHTNMEDFSQRASAIANQSNYKKQQRFGRTKGSNGSSQKNTRSERRSQNVSESVSFISESVHIIEEKYSSGHLNQDINQETQEQEEESWSAGRESMRNQCAIKKRVVELLKNMDLESEEDDYTNQNMIYSQSFLTQYSVLQDQLVRTNQQLDLFKQIQSQIQMQQQLIEAISNKIK